MLRTGLVHPEILRALGTAGHGSQVLISDGNFPHSTAPQPAATRVYLNVSRGLVRVSDVLEVLVPVLPIEAATLMDPDSGDRPTVHAALEALLPADTPVARLHRFDFYAATRTERLVLVIATGDERAYANVLLTVGGIPSR